jgi:magnesium transporter
MTTEYVAVPQGITLEQAFTQVRNLEILPDFLLYFYVLENELSNKLAGVVSMYEFFSKDLRSRLETVMIKNVICAYPNDHIKDTLKKLYRYDISALPVVTKSDRKLLGIVTFRDAITSYLPKRWKLRMRRVFNNSA